MVPSMDREHHYRVELRWTGNRGENTRRYDAYRRDHLLSAPGKETLRGSSDPQFRGDASAWNPEELLVAALASCHMLSYLHLCATHSVEVAEYQDAPEGTMELAPEGGGRFTRVVLRPKVLIASGDVEVARRLHDEAHHQCFIASSVNFPVRHEPIVEVLPAKTRPSL